MARQTELSIMRRCYDPRDSWPSLIRSSDRIIQTNLACRILPVFSHTKPKLYPHLDHDKASFAESPLTPSLASFLFGVCPSPTSPYC